MYAGSVRDVPGKIASPGSMKSKAFNKKSLLSFSLLLMTGFNVLAPTSGFVAYDCMNASNTVEAYSLLAPEECHVTGGEHKVERIVQAEVVQIKRERTINVFRCQVLETLVSQYCGHSSAAGVTRYLRFREPLLVEASSCRKALTDAGNITIANTVEISGPGLVQLPPTHSLWPATWMMAITAKQVQLALEIKY
jgi:hypothetical protein